MREEYCADWAIIDVNKPHTVTKDKVLYKCGWIPFEGKAFHSSIAATILNGQVIYENVAPINEPILGQQLMFDR